VSMLARQNATRQGGFGAITHPSTTPLDVITLDYAGGLHSQ